MMYICVFISLTIRQTTVFVRLTSVAEVVEQDDLTEVFGRRPVDHAVHRAQEGRPRLVVEDYHHTGRRQVARVRQVVTPTRMNE